MSITELQKIIAQKRQQAITKTNSENNLERKDALFQDWKRYYDAACVIDEIVREMNVAPLAHDEEPDEMYYIK